MTPRETYTSHTISIKHHLSHLRPSIHTPALSPRLAPHLRTSQTFPSHNEGFRAPDGSLSGINFEEVGDGEQMKVGQKRYGLGIGRI